MTILLPEAHGVRAEYPRPDFERSEHWVSLNGLWAFAPDPDDEGRDAGWSRALPSEGQTEILVPFPWESPASRVEEEWLEVGWYQRSARRPGDWPADHRAILHFGAVHHQADVWVNGVAAGSHVGGSLPFAFDVTDLLDGRGGADVVVRVHAPADKAAIPHGKQRSQPADPYDDCAFTASSGIWQSVWLEARPATHVADVQVRPNEACDGFGVAVTVAGPEAAGATVSVSLGDVLVPARCDDDGRAAVTVPVAAPRLWSPADPFLYALVVEIAGGDAVRVTSGLRRVEVRGDRIYLNGERLYVRGVLDQGFWPGCGHTAPSDDDLRRDLQLARDAGFNLVRKHIKLEDPRWLHWADRLGMLVWAEPPCTGRWSHAGAAAFEEQIEPMVTRDGNHPSIVIWGLYNEEWGLDWALDGDAEKQEVVRRAMRTLRAADATRPAVDNSGWFHVDTDLVDWHYYAKHPSDWRELVSGLVDGSRDGFTVQVGPGYSLDMRLAVAGVSVDGLPLLNSEYGGGAFDEATRAWHLRWETQELRRHDGMQGYVYTELFDVEYELCGVYDEQREPKLGHAAAVDANAETALVLDLVPVRPGADVVVAADGAIAFAAAVSHHGTDTLHGRIAWSWEGEGDDDTRTAQVDVAPFRLVPVDVRDVLPRQQSTGRLLVRFEDHDGHVRARTYVDVARD
jgi:hypothetical protein